MDGARAITHSPHLRQRLERLWLEDNFLGNEEGEEEVLEILEAWLGDGLRRDTSPVEEDYDEI